MSSGKYKYAFPAFRVFIFGIEVTDSVLSINTSMHDGAAPNQCNISLVNELDRYVMTTNDMLSLTGLDGGTLNLPWLDSDENVGNYIVPQFPTADSSPEQISNFRSLVQNKIIQARKRQILDRKLAVLQSINSENVLDMFGEPVTAAYTNYFGKTVAKYPISDGMPIFHPMDPVRVFMRDPFNPTKWYHMFAGFISDLAHSADENNQKTLNVVVEDATKLLRYTRIAVNPGIVDANVAIDENDLTAISFNTNFLQGKSLPEAFYTIIFGPDAIGASDLISDGNKQSKIKTKMRAIGHFNIEQSQIFTCGPEPIAEPEYTSETGLFGSGEFSGFKNPIHLNDELNVWQAVIDHEVKPSDLITMHVLDSPHETEFEVGLMQADSDGRILTEEVIKFIGEHPDRYLVDGGRLLMLIPRSLGERNNKVLINDIIQSYPLQTDWVSAGQVLYDIVDRIQFSMYCTPKGDIVIEPPMYDFDPDSFGLEGVSADQMKAVSYLSSMSNKYKDGPRGPFGQNFVIRKGDTYNYDVAQLDSQVYTMALAKHSIFQNWETLPYSDIIGDLQNVTLRDLIPLYGVRQAPLTPRGYINTIEGARLYATICLARLNADARTVGIRHIPNIKMWVNRPHYIQVCNAICTTKKINHNLIWGKSGDMSTTSEMYAMRTWTGQVEEGTSRPEFTSIGGNQMSSLNNYAVLFKMRQPAGKKIADKVIDLPPGQEIS